MSAEKTLQQDIASQPAAQLFQTQAANDASGMPWITLIVTLGVCFGAFLAYRHYDAAGVSSASCYRVIDMNRLTNTLLSDMIDKTAGMQADAAGTNYRTRLKTLDSEVMRLAGGCLLLRRDAVIMPDPALDITAQVAAVLNIDIAKSPSSAAAPPASGAMASKPAAVPASQASGNGVQIPDALGSKLD
jgi:hypothetical protein